MFGLGSESWASSGTTAIQDSSAAQDSPEFKTESPDDSTVLEYTSGEQDADDEKSLLLGHSHPVGAQNMRPRSQTSIARRIASAIFGTFRFVISVVLAPGRYLIACFYDEHGHFSAAMPVYAVAQTISGTKRAEPQHGMAAQSSGQRSLQNHASDAFDEKAPALSSDSEADSDTSRPNSPTEDSPAQNTRSKATPGPTTEESDASAPKRAPRIKIVNQDELRRRKQRRAQAASASASSQEPPLTIATIKSPTSASSALRLTRYPRAPAPPRPLIPRRQPSYSSLNPSVSANQKTLVIDLDETLIHSMAKGGRMSTGHMVEVKLSSPVGHAGNLIGPQVPILYYVHKRPHCDEFLRKVSKWYNLIVFTASVQEYADPVIDWLELERKYFSARYYRQHCTYRNGAYIKDLSQVEPDLSKVMILDNSPMSYIFHEDNAIPIEGWISDPTDNDLLHLIPLFEALQHTTDVRALLALRLGEAVS